jgi:hypothetical protein
MLPAIDPKFTAPRISGIAAEVKETHNEFTTTVTRPVREKG